MQFQVAFQVAFLLTGWLSAGCSATYDQCVTQVSPINLIRVGSRRIGRVALFLQGGDQERLQKSLARRIVGAHRFRD